MEESQFSLLTPFQVNILYLYPLKTFQNITKLFSNFFFFFSGGGWGGGGRGGGRKREHWRAREHYLFKVNNRNTKTRREICSKLTMKTPERRRCLLSLLLTLNRSDLTHCFVVSIADYEQVNAGFVCVCVCVCVCLFPFTVKVSPDCTKQ